MTQLQILKDDLQHLRDKWKNRKEVWYNTRYPDHLEFRIDRFRAEWIKRQLETLSEASPEFLEVLFGK